MKKIFLLYLLVSIGIAYCSNPVKPSCTFKPHAMAPKNISAYAATCQPPQTPYSLPYAVPNYLCKTTQVLLKNGNVQYQANCQLGKYPIRYQDSFLDAPGFHGMANAVSLLAAAKIGQNTAVAAKPLKK